MRIPLIRPYMPPMRDIARIYSKAYKSRIHSNFGPLFEEAVAFLNEKTNRHCLPVSTGTAAIEIACRMQFRPGSRILVPDYTHVGTIVAIKAADCIPVLHQSSNLTWTICPWAINHYPNIDGVVAVSPFGMRVNVEEIDAACKAKGIKAVYDFAGAWGSFPKTDNPVCYSLHATKNFSCGEGGVISFSNKAQWLRGRWLSNFCNDPDRIVRSLNGRNHKPSELLCAVILAHAKNYDQIIDRIETKGDRLEEYYRETEGYYTPGEGSISLCVLDGMTAAQAERLKSKGIETKQYYTPLPAGLCSTISRTPLKEVLSRYALPSDVTDREAKEVIRVLNECKKKS